jgi:hypothetical protein
MILTPRKFVSSSQGRGCAIVAVDVVGGGGLEPCEFAVVVVVKGRGLSRLCSQDSLLREPPVVELVARALRVCCGCCWWSLSPTGSAGKEIPITSQSS